jgi:hypothetical protein
MLDKERPMLSEALLAKVIERANDPERCTDTASIGARTMDLGSLLGQLGPAGDQLKAMQGQMGGLMGQFASIMQGFGVVNPLPQAGDAKAARHQSNQVPPPTGEERIMAAEAALGFALPEALKQLYLKVADGGFGPGQGLYSLHRLVGEYRDFTSEPFGPQGQPWPASLIAICHDDPGEICLDRESGKIIFWDPEELAEGQGDKYWRRSFKDEADSLSAWLEKWVGAPTAMERMAEVRREGDERAIQASIAAFAAMSPEERAAHGLSEDNWQEEIRGRYYGRY